MKKVRIDRATWRRGDDTASGHYGPTFLLNREGMMCCLGFDCMQNGGTTRSDIIGATGPFRTGKRIEGLSEWNDEMSCVIVTNFSNAAMEINDSNEITEEERESLLIDLAAKHGREYEFYGETPADMFKVGQ